jgi:hypothetical protein
MATMQLRRIFGDAVVAAYRKTGLRPVRGLTAFRSGGCLCGCPITALYLATVDKPPAKVTTLENRVDAWAEKQFGGDYILPFVCAFDTPEAICTYGTEIGILAHADGVAVAQAVFAAFPEAAI